MKLVPATLPSSEVPKTPIDANRGEKTHGGRIVASLPALMKPCPVVYEEPVAQHDPECECGGRGEVPVHRPEIEAVDPADDSLMALEDALETGNTVDSYLGASVTELMHRDVDVKGGGGGGRKRSRKPSASELGSAPLRSAIDGRLERTGRKPRFHSKVGPRKDLIHTTVKDTTAGDGADGGDLARIAEELLANPDYQALLLEIKNKKGDAVPPS